MGLPLPGTLKHTSKPESLQEAPFGKRPSQDGHLVMKGALEVWLWSKACHPTRTAQALKQLTGSSEVVGARRWVKCGGAKVISQQMASALKPYQATTRQLGVRRVHKRAVEFSSTPHPCG